MTITLAELTQISGLEVLEHLEREIAIPVVDGVQAQGDLIVIPAAILGEIRVPEHQHWREVPPSGVELLRSAGGGNPHTLVGERRTCEWTAWVHDPEGLAIGVLRNTRPAYLIHPEHGGSGIAPGTWVVRRQRERGFAHPRWSTAVSSRRDTLVAD